MPEKLLIDPRSIVQIASDAEKGVAEKPLSPWHHHVRWTAKDAGIMCDRMREFFQSPYGLLMTHPLVSNGGLQFGSNQDPVRLTAQRYLDFWASDDLLTGFLDDATADMVLASSLTAPNGGLHEDELLAPSGAIFFENPTTAFDEIFDRLPSPEIAPIRAITWELGFDNAGTIIGLTTYYDGSETNFADDSTTASANFHAFVKNVGTYMNIGLLENFILGDAESESTVSAQKLINYLRALTAIARSPRTNSVKKSVTVSKRKKGKRTYTTERTVTIMSLQRPETARYELDGARGSVQRLHWVRGHWRRQWYATVEDHRLKWIDGFIKGDPDKGTTQSRKVVKI
ncbi:hypothetical protein [Glutamicibacter ardleyensis]|uniref:hypothetical protein n=1 Tax=Glutamicibacter ardleyensis TaxID=225894 RepID=UPI003FD24237